MRRDESTIFIIAGPNGAGKSTIARRVLAETLGLVEFVNADAIAAGLSGFDPSRVAFAAGRVMLARLHELGDGDTSFAFESTLSSRTFAPWLWRLTGRGWQVHIAYVWVRTADLAIRRVQHRVRMGGHNVPADIVRRRYARSAAAFWTLYRPLASTWQVYDNSGRSPRLIASGQRSNQSQILDRHRFDPFVEVAHGR